MLFLRQLSLIIGVSAAFLGISVAYAQDDVLNLRLQSPFTQVYGLPTFLSGELLPAGQSSLGLNVGVINHADQGVEADERIVLDGETLAVEIGATWSIGERWQFQVTLPYYEYSGGFLDAPIEQFHSIVGFNNSQRDGPRGRMLVAYEGDGVTGVAQQKHGENG